MPRGAAQDPAQHVAAPLVRQAARRRRSGRSPRARGPPPRAARRPSRGPGRARTPAISCARSRIAAEEVGVVDRRRRPARRRQVARVPRRCRSTASEAASCVPDASRLNCMKTRFQISMKRPHSQAGLQCGIRAVRRLSEVEVDLRAGPAGARCPPSPRSCPPRRGGRADPRGMPMPSRQRSPGVVVLAKHRDVQALRGRAEVLASPAPRRTRSPRA